MVFINHLEVLNGEVAIVEVEGPLNGNTSPDFEDYINKLLNKNMPFIIFDAGKLEYVSSEGIGVMLFIQKKISENNGFFVIFNLSDEIISLYKLLGFDKIFRIAGSRTEAMQIMDRQFELRDDYSDKNKDNNKDNNKVTVKKEEDPESKTIGKKFSDNDQIIEKQHKIDKSINNDVSVFNPFIIECAKCKSLIRIKKIGTYNCPECGIEFSVNNDYSAVF